MLRSRSFADAMSRVGQLDKRGVAIRLPIGRPTPAIRSQVRQAHDAQAEARVVHRRRHHRDGRGADEAAQDRRGRHGKRRAPGANACAVHGFMQAAQDEKRGAIDVDASRCDLRRAVDLLSAPEVDALHDDRATDNLAVVKSGRNP